MSHPLSPTLINYVTLLSCLQSDGNLCGIPASVNYMCYTETFTVPSLHLLYCEIELGWYGEGGPCKNGKGSL